MDRVIKIKRYAAILKDRVIDVKESNYKPIYPPDIDNNSIIVLECDDTVQIGDIYADGKIIGTKVVEPTQLDRIEEAVLKSNEELRQEGYDNCVMYFVEEGVI